MIGIGIGISRNGGPSLPALDITTPVSVAWSAGTATITPPVASPVHTGLTYTATVDGVPATITGLTFPAAQGPLSKVIQVTALMTRADYRTTTSTAYADVPAAPAIGFTASPTITGSAAYGATRGLAFTTFGTPALPQPINGCWMASLCPVLPLPPSAAASRIKRSNAT